MNKIKIANFSIVMMLALSTVTILGTSPCAVTSTEEIEVNIPLLEGFNLVTIPIENDYLASILADLIVGCESISMWDVDDQTIELI